MTSVYKKFFSGYLLILFDIKLESFDILMDSLGYLFIYLAFLTLYKKDKHKELKIGLVLTGIMMLYSLPLDFIGQSTSSISLSTTSYILMLLSMIMSATIVVIIYKASVREGKLIMDSDQLDSLIKECDQYAIINALIILAMSSIMIISARYITGLIIVTVITGFIVQIRFIITLNRIKNAWMAWEESESHINLEV